ncbi:MAG: M23 family metallopeptidase [Alphaproteobacteria bacterium]|nr:M23 family metallopeptidase [Alphaproteobacteria bacterium]
MTLIDTAERPRDVRFARASAPAIALRPPLRLPERQPLSLEDTLVSIGIVPRQHLRGTHGLLWRWFRHESTAMAAGNLAATVLLLVIALTMTGVGMQLAVALNLAPTIYVVLNDGLPYFGIAFITAGALKAIHAWYAHKAAWWSRALGYALASLLIASGVWVEVMAGFADFVPWMFQPAVALAGGENTARIASFNMALVSYFEPGVAALLGLLLLAKHSKTGTTRRAPLVRQRVALAGIGLSLLLFAVGANAGWRHYTGADKRDGMEFAVGGETLRVADRTYGPLFAKGVPCHLSSLYGWRTDPVGKIETRLHQGVDIAVKAGTPVQAMVSGRVMFAATDAGLGNFVAIASGKGPTVVNGHMETLLVQPGQMVNRGDVIGLAGSTGHSTGPHVHLQLCPGGHMNARGGFSCGGSTNPYENWPTLAALARMTCVDGPRFF